MAAPGATTILRARAGAAIIRAVSAVRPSSRHTPPNPMDPSRLKLIGVAVAAAIVVFLVGYLPQRSRAAGYRDDLRQARHELKFARLEGRLGAALSESLRSNYERSRQLMADFFSELQSSTGQVTDARQRQALEGILAQRDEIITLLSRAQPESTQRLMLLYTTYFAAMDPAGRNSPAVTPPPPPPAPPPAAPSTAPARPQAEKAPAKR